MKYIFVSSTFKDMQAERDMLHLKVLPEVNYAAQKYGDEVGLIDLRWGVVTENLESDQVANKVLSVCLDEIDRCKPYMVVFLGERYGWIPDESAAYQWLANKEITLESLEQSVTALEIEYGILSQNDNWDKCLFCIRKPLSTRHMSPEDKQVYIDQHPDSQAKLKQLKKRVESLMKNSIIYYKASWDPQLECLTGLDHLAADLTKSLVKLFQKDWESYSALTWQAIESQKTDAYVKHFQLTPEMSSHPLDHLDESAASHVNTQEYTSNLAKKCLENDLTFIKGAPASGTSSRLFKVSQSLSDTCTVFTVICGKSLHSRDLYDMIQMLLFHFERLYAERFGLTKRTDYSAPHSLEDLCQELEAFTAMSVQSPSPIVFFIDGMDQLKDHLLMHHMSWLPRKAMLGKTHFVLSLHADYKCQVKNHFEYDSPYKVYNEMISPLSDPELKGLIIHQVSQQGKSLSSRLIDAIMAKENRQNLSYLTLLIHRLMLMSERDFKAADQLGQGEEGLTQELVHLIQTAPNDEGALARWVIEEGAKRLGDYSGLVRTLNLLACTRYGLRLKDLEAITTELGYTWEMLTFSSLLKFYAAYFLIDDSGLVNFKSSTIKEAFYPRYKIDQEGMHSAISHYIYALPKTHDLRLSEGLYHAFMCQRTHSLYNLLDFSEGQLTALQINQLAQDLHDLLMVHGDAFLTKALTQLDTQDFHLLKETASFLIGPLYDCFDESHKESDIGIRLYSCLSQVCHEMCQTSQGSQSLTCLRLEIFAYYRLSIFYTYQNQTRLALERALDAYNLYNNDLLDAPEYNKVVTGREIAYKDMTLMSQRLVDAFMDEGDFENATYCANENIDLWDHVSEDTMNEILITELAHAHYDRARVILRNEITPNKGPALKDLVTSLSLVGLPIGAELPQMDTPYPCASMIHWETEKEIYLKDWIRVFDHLSDFGLDDMTDDDCMTYCDYYTQLSKAYMTDEDWSLMRNAAVYSLVLGEKAAKSQRLKALSRLAEAYQLLFIAYHFMNRSDDALLLYERADKVYQTLYKRSQLESDHNAMRLHQELKKMIENAF